MCGIAGIYYFDRERRASPDVIAAMCASMAHRGPDGEGQLVDGNLGMGMRRLAVIDLDSGQQPIYNENGSVAVVFNGEIFNYQDLRGELERLGHVFATQSDTEVLAHGYETWGHEVVSRLNGMFAFSIWDKANRKLLLARDHIGIKPLYLIRNDRFIAWASEIKALLRVPGVSAELDKPGLLDFLRFGYVPGPRTLFRNIVKVAPASIISVEDRSVRSRTYWDLSFASEPRPDEEWTENLRHLLDDAVRRQLVSDVPLGAFLSGGLDSSSIVATMHRLGVAKVATYAIGFDGPDAFHSELPKAARLADHFGTDHHEIVVKPDVAELLFRLTEHLDEPLTDTSFLVTYLVSELARRSVTVILSGVGGDEIFAGYRRYLGPRLQAWYRKCPRVIRKRAIWPALRRMPVDRGSAVKSMLRYARGFAAQDELPAASRYQGYVSVFDETQRAELMSPEFKSIEADHASRQIAERYEAAPSDDPVNQMFYADLKTSLVDSLLMFTDKMTMATSLEARVPLLDFRLVELAAKIPPRLRLRGVQPGGMKHIFKSAVQDRLPKPVLRQKKQGFGTPISRWFRSSLKPLVSELLSPERVTSRGYFDPTIVQRLISDHDAQRDDYSEHIMALLSFEAWHQIYLD